MKFFFISIISIFFIVSIYAEGSTDSQSQALLFKQKRTEWEGAPDSAVFYECYLVRYNNDSTTLLDFYLKTGQSKDSILFVSNDTSMKIRAQNAEIMLKEPYIIYKCIVFYSVAMLGEAVVNIFKADPVNIRIGILYGDKAYFSDNQRTCIVLDQWPNPTLFTILDMIEYWEKEYNEIISNYDKGLEEAETEQEKYSLLESKAEYIKYYENIISQPLLSLEL
ncbi:hypothetical protein TREPR_2037 [Treponema primitia ZAS-2]|uniref:Uncharacterized protein n=1 Tax=Treponema primitia (strain ATCC BAA-887 / DSM 12427 / ZAS-2) TaxID=545694 RepID=F5YJU7_TREPZ|nr:hypothetical protein [Treponema primitia]AEF84087.1 hypothetical protein TREPR_2037 [Treponema primitia ZAS-2]